MGLMLIVGIAWMVLAVAVAMMIGRTIRAADARAVPGTDDRFPASAPESDAQVLTLQLTRGRTLA